MVNEIKPSFVFIFIFIFISTGRHVPTCAHRLLYDEQIVILIPCGLMPIHVLNTGCVNQNVAITPSFFHQLLC